MRDLILLVILIGTCVYSLRKPWIGIVAWTAVSLGSPHMAFGYAAGGWPVASAIGGCLLIGLFVTRERVNPMAGPASWAVLALTLWLCITLPFSFDINKSLPLWERSMKIFLMIFVSMALLDTRRKLDIFIWAIVVSVGYYGVKGGLFTLATGGNYRIWGPGGFIGGNNELASAFVMTIPLMRYLQLQSGNTWVRRGLLLSMVLCGIAAIGTYSRGALLGTTGMLLFFILRSDRKLMWAVLLVAAMLVGLASMPDHWWDRMGTLRTYKQDESAMGRIIAWGVAWNIAADRIFGGGFMVSLPWVYERYASGDYGAALVAHSIYFQMLGEHGFIGLGLYLLVGVLTWVNAIKLRRMARSDPALRWAGDLGSMVQVSMIGFAITGAFLSLAYFDLPFNVMVIAALAVRFASAAATASARAPSSTPAQAAASSMPSAGAAPDGGPTAT